MSDRAELVDYMDVDVSRPRTLAYVTFGLVQMSKRRTRQLEEWKMKTCRNRIESVWSVTIQSTDLGPVGENREKCVGETISIKKSPSVALETHYSFRMSSLYEKERSMKGQKIVSNSRHRRPARIKREHANRLSKLSERRMPNANRNEGSECQTSSTRPSKGLTYRRRGLRLHTYIRVCVYVLVWQGVSRVAKRERYIRTYVSKERLRRASSQSAGATCC